MIGALVEHLSRRVAAADLVQTSDDTLSLTLDDRGDVSLESDASAGLHVRVLANGRVGWAGGSAATPAAVVEAAVGAAAGGEPLELMLPAPAPLPAVSTARPGAPRAEGPELLGLARALRDRLAGSGRRVEVWAERSLGAVAVANTRGVVAEYPRVLAGLGAVVWGPSADADAPLRLERVETALPGYEAVEDVAREADRWLGLPELGEGVAGGLRAWLLPAAVRTLLWPVLVRLAGEAWARGDAAGIELDGRLTLTDDPLAPNRPGSRPICDDGVPTRAITLVEHGRPRRGIVDLATAARSGLPATGHGRRRALGAPRAAYSNLSLAPGEAGPEALAAAVGDGVLVLDLPWGPAPARASGVFRARAPWTFAVRRGEIVGRLSGVLLSGNAFELLRRVVAVGRDAEWRGAWRVPSLVIDGLQAGRA